MSRIAREISLIRELDPIGRSNYRDAMSKGMAEHSGRYGAVNERMSDVLGVNLVDRLTEYPSQLKIVENRPSTKGLAWDGNVWVKGDLPYKDKVLNHELAHVGFGHSGSNLPTAIQEIQAEGTSFGVGHRLGIPTDVLVMSSAPTLNSRMLQYSPEQIGNILEQHRSGIGSMVDAFMNGRAPSGYRIARTEMFGS